MCHGWEEDGAGSVVGISATQPAPFYSDARGRGTRLSHNGDLMACKLSEQIRCKYCLWVAVNVGLLPSELP